MKILHGPFIAGRAAWGLLVMRVFFGLGLAEHGFQKIQAGPLHWGDDMATMPMHLVIPPFWQGMATLAEFGGGLAMMFGLLTPLAMLGIVVTMGFAILKFHLPRGAVYVFTPGKPDFEPAGHYLIAAVGLLLTGPGKWSLDALIFGRQREKTACRSRPEGIEVNAADLVADLIFGTIGMAAFMYGRKQGRLKTTLIAVVIMAYPYFVSGTLLLYGIGLVLTVALFLIRD